jgi:hypothetical protein
MASADEHVALEVDDALRVVVALRPVLDEDPNERLLIIIVGRYPGFYARNVRHCRATLAETAPVVRIRDPCHRRFVKTIPLRSTPGADQTVHTLDITQDSG